MRHTMDASKPGSGTASRARLATATMFFINGAVLANWVPRIPAIQQRLGLSTGALGFALLGMALGGLVANPTAGPLVVRFGSRRVTVVAGVAYCAVLPLPALAPTLPLLTLALIILGASNGLMDVAMNSQGVAVERTAGRPLLSSFHGMFSVGGLVGASVGGVIAVRGIAPATHLSAAAAVLGVLTIIAGRGLLPASADAGAGAMDGGATRTPLFVRPTGPLVALAIIAFCVMLGEGAMADWSALYLRESLGTNAGLAAAGYACFSLGMVAGRFAGDTLAEHVGPPRLVTAGGALAAVGLGFGLLTGQPLAALVGFVCVGLGFSTVVPLAISAAGRTRGVASGLAIAAVTTTGYFGFLVGPPVIGLLAQALTLRAALGVVVALAVIIAALGRRVATPPDTPDGAAPGPVARDVTVDTTETR